MTAEPAEDVAEDRTEDVRSDYGRGYADALDDLRIGADRYAEHRRGAATTEPNRAAAGLVLCAAAVWAGWQLGGLLCAVIFGESSR